MLFISYQLMFSETEENVSNGFVWSCEIVETIFALESEAKAADSEI